MATYAEKLEAMKLVAADNAHDVESLCNMLDITYDDLLNCFSDKLVRAYPTYFPNDEDEEAY